MFTLLELLFIVKIALLLFLMIKIILELLNKRKAKYLKSLRLLLNFGLLFPFCYFTILRVAMVVEIPPFARETTAMETLNHLNQWLLELLLKIGLIGLGLITLLWVFNYYFQKRFERLNLKRPITFITLINFLFLVVTLILTYFNAFNSLSLDVNVISTFR